MTNKFKVGDRVVRTALPIPEIKTGEVYTIKEVGPSYYCSHDGIILKELSEFPYNSKYFELAVEGDKSNWHPHHDVIVAWGAEIQSRYGDDSMWIDCEHPKFWVDWEHRIKPTNNNQDQISKIESEMRELSEKQKELADCLNELKKEM